MNPKIIKFILLVCILLASCSSDDNAQGDLATLEVSASWDGELPDEAKFLVTLLKCPFVMPPEYSAIADIANKEMSLSINNIVPGDWCLTAVIDVNPEDGLLPKPGYDITLLGLELNESIPVTLLAGQTKHVTVDFELKNVDGDYDNDNNNADGDMDNTDGEGTEPKDPQADDVWLRLSVDCETCTTDTPLIFYGYKGTELGIIPDLYNKFVSDISFPIDFVIKESGALSSEKIEAGQYNVSVYQDTNNQGMKPEDGEPVATPIVVDIVAGEWNDITFSLE